MSRSSPGNDTQGQPAEESAVEEQIGERIAPSVAVIHGVIRRFGEDELSRSAEGLAWSGLSAGLSMGFSLVGQGLLLAFLPNEPWRPLIFRLGYSIGFLIVILGRQQLFTENTLTVILPLLTRPTLGNLMRVLRLWAIVLATNLIGALIFAWVVGNTAVFTSPIREAFAEIGREAYGAGFGTVVVQGIFAGWLIALMVWLLPLAESARVGVIIIVTYLVGLGDLAHIIAGSVEVFYLSATGVITYGQYLGGFMLPTLIGNVIGGVALVAALSYAQVYAGRR